jgi:hypothetical protein
MRALLLVLAVAACTPDIAPGAYLCGAERSCPDDLACDGVDHVCVLPSAAQPFACGAGDEVEPNNDLVRAQPVLPDAACASLPAELVGCIADGDGADYYRVAVPAECTSVAASARLVFPLAFMPLAVAVVDRDGAVLGEGAPCENDDPDDGETRMCVVADVTPGQDALVRVQGTSEATCGGACAHNQYILTMQLQAFAAP